LLSGKFGRDMNSDYHVMVALAVAGDTADALAPKTDLSTGLSARRYADFNRAIHCLNFLNNSKCCLRKRNLLTRAQSAEDQRDQT